MNDNAAELLADTNEKLSEKFYAEALRIRKDHDLPPTRDLRFDAGYSVGAAGASFVGLIVLAADAGRWPSAVGMALSLLLSLGFAWRTANLKASATAAREKND